MNAMTFTKTLVAAAISDLADLKMEEKNTPQTDMDAISKFMAEAQVEIANELARSGMTLHEAEKLADAASETMGRTTEASTDLARRALQNRHSSVPSAAAPAASPPPASPDATSSASPDVGGVSAVAQPTSAGSPMTAAQTSSAPAPIQAGTAAPQPVIAEVAVVAAPAVITAPIREEDKRVPHEVHMRPVHEVFPIEPGDPMFAFDLPYIDWKGDREGIPPIDVSYNLDIEHLHTMLYAMSTGITTNLVGPHGCGKTEFVRNIAARLNFPISEIPMDGQIGRSQLIGKEALISGPYGSQTLFRRGILPKALLDPGVILFDEVDRGQSDLQYACHSVYLRQGLKLLEDGGAHIPSHKYTRVFATANTKGRGSFDGMYQASEEMSEASRDRFSLWIEMSYQREDDDVLVIMKKVPGIDKKAAEMIAKLATMIRTAFLDSRLAQTCSMRQQLEVASYYMFMSRKEKDDVRRKLMLRKAVETVICNRASTEDKGAIATDLQAIMPEAYAPGAAALF